MIESTAVRYTIHELVELTGISARTMHYYVKEGLIPRPIRTGGRARYTDAHLSRLLLIREYQIGFGKTLSVIKGILSHIRDEDLKDQFELVKKERELAPIENNKLVIRRAYAKSLFKEVRVVVATEDSRKPHEPPQEEGWIRIKIIDGFEINILNDIYRQRRKQMKKLIEDLRYELAENPPT